MKKIYISLISILIVISIAFCGLWIFEINNHSDIEDLCQHSVSYSFCDFIEYKNNGAEDQYWSAVSHFGTYIDTWTKLGGSEKAEYLWCNELYGYMLINPQAVQENIGELLKALELLDSDYLNPNGHNQINSLNHLIAEQTK